MLGFEELPELLTVEEAAVFLRVSRGVGYQLARRFWDTNGREGLPVVLVDRQLGVSKRQIERLLNGRLSLDGERHQPQQAPRRVPRRPRRPAPHVRAARAAAARPADAVLTMRVGHLPLMSTDSDFTDGCTVCAPVLLPYQTVGHR